MPKEFTITDSVSSTAWGNVDKSRIWRILKQGLQEGAKGIKEAIREVYAVVKVEINEDLTQADCWGPHHEVRDDGSIVLNRAGLIAAAGALAGARAEPNLTPEQKRKAARHLARHYRELELPVPESLQEIMGEMISVQAHVSGEMKVEDVPVAPWANIEKLKEGDPEPMEVVVEIPAGKSTRGWNYTPQALQSIVEMVMKQGLPGFLGHQKPEDASYQFPTPVTHWVGALWKDGKAYFRGVIDKAASDLKRWIKANVVRTVSIYGIPKLQYTAGETHVIDYKPLSIDWTPLGRAGMPTAVVAIGEMDEIINNGNNGGVERVDKKELLKQLKEMLESGEITLSEVAEEMGWTAPQLAGEIDSEWAKQVNTAVETLGKIKAEFGITGEMDVLTVLNEAKAALEEKKAKAQEQLIDETIKEKVVGEMAQTLVKKMLHVDGEITKEKVAGEIDKLLEDPAVKAAINAFYKDSPPPIGGNDNKSSTTLRVKRQVI